MKLNTDMSRFSIGEVEEHQYEHYVRLTAILLYGSFMTKDGKVTCKPGSYVKVHRIFEAEKWPMERIIRMYNNAMNYHGSMPRDVYWWWQRKQMKSTSDGAQS